ncbi:MAG: efflux RND transporter periplasmic adaptor subunit [Veillonellales bacterium]
MTAVWQKIRRYKLWLIALLIVAGAVQMTGVLRTGKAQQPAKVTTITAERGEVTSVVSATGTISPVNMVDISSKISGLIEEVKVAENDHVKAGQVLFVLDDSHLQTQVSQARARLASAAASYERSQRLHDIDGISDQQLDTARTDYSVAQAAYDDAVSQLADTIIKAPIDGVVIGKPTPAGQAVSPGFSSQMVLMTIADMDKMQIQTQVDESDIGKVKNGQHVTFTVDAYPGETFTGVVSNVSQKATVQSNVVYYNVMVDVDNKENLLKPTMTARVSINVGQSSNTLVVPLTAVKMINGQYVVGVEKDGKVENAVVTTGLSNDEKIEILSGLTDGDHVVVSQVKTQDNAAKSGNGGTSGGMNLFRGMGR